MNSVTKLLFSPYPLPGQQSVNRSIRISVLTGIFIFLFLFFISPFNMGINSVSEKLLVTGSYGLITALIQIIFLVLLPPYLEKYFQESHWNFLKAISYILTMVLVIALCNFLFTGWYFEEVDFNLQTLSSTIIGTLVVAIFPVVFFVAIDLVRYENRYKKDSEEIVLHHSPVEIKEILIIPSEYDEDNLTIDIENFLFAESDANYVSFYYRKKDEIKRTLIRTTLKKVQQLVISHPYILKTHRSYIINLKSVSKFEGNAQGYEMYFEGTETLAKVSRSYTNKVKELLKQLN